MAKPRATTRRKKGAGKVAEAYAHPVSVPAHAARGGYAAAIQKEKAAPPVTYRYDSSLSPSLDWDGGNGARELGEWLLRVIEEAAGRPAPHTLSAPAEFRAADGQVLVSVGSLQEAVDQLKRLSRPFLDWTGKAERLSFDVPTLLPLFVHERLSTRAIVETLVGHKTDTQTDFWALLGDPRHSIADQVLKAYEYPDQWVNRLILGDSLVVMNSLLHYERLGGQVQMIYIDPPYGVKFGSNFQPFVRLDQPRMLADNDERRALIESLRVLSNDDIMRALQATGVLYLEGHTDLEILWGLREGAESSCAASADPRPVLETDGCRYPAGPARHQGPGALRCAAARAW